MADESEVLTWTEACQLLDANFPFRSPVSMAGQRRSYRSRPNDPSMDVWSEGNIVWVELNRIVPNLKELSGTQTGPKYRYRVANKSDLLECVTGCLNPPLSGGAAGM
jgi:hypothetical protein